jgi:hypothetical protein
MYELFIYIAHLYRKLRLWIWTDYGIKKMDENRSKFYEIIDGRAVDITYDEYTIV